MRTCAKCKEEKSLDLFAWLDKAHTKKQYYCKKCQSAIRTARRKANRPLEYGITWDDYNRMLEDQGNVCAICGTSDPGHTREVWCIDHCHTTGKVRGLLCNTCNIGLGAFRDNTANLAKAIDYLEANV